MRISIIVAMGLSRQIGLQGKIPWHLSSDLQNFKKITMGHTLVLGRRTFESVGKALPGRKTIVLTRDESFTAKDCQRARNLQEAIDLAKEAGETEVFLAGGSEVYARGLALADRLYLSFVNYKGPADTFFPAYTMEAWKKLDSQVFPETEKDLAWTYEVWDRI